MSAASAKNYFLSRPAQFSDVARRGGRKLGKFWRVTGLPNNVANARLGLVLSKRHVHKASLRNRLRRLLRESFRQHWQSALPSFDFLVFSAPSLAKAEEFEAREDCRCLLKNFK
ncbi:MAG: ribonuclease P protein component [Candidatus Zeuxoniibacter abyssi]|nr:MAG: ribonuclease P protein component [Candidatus Persebacteraceae bacterium AB1(2)]